MGKGKLVRVKGVVVHALRVESGTVYIVCGLIDRVSSSKEKEEAERCCVLGRYIGGG